MKPHTYVGQSIILILFIIKIVSKMCPYIYLQDEGVYYHLGFTMIGYVISEIYLLADNTLCNTMECFSLRDKDVSIARIILPIRILPLFMFGFIFCMHGRSLLL